MTAKQEKVEWELPHLREVHQIPVSQTGNIYCSLSTYIPRIAELALIGMSSCRHWLRELQPAKAVCNFPRVMQLH